MSKVKNLGEMLLEANLVDSIQLRIAVQEHLSRKTRLGSTLVSLNFIDENVLAAFLSKQTDIPCISLLNIDIPAPVRGLFSPTEARSWDAVPVKVDQGILSVAMSDPFNVEILDDISAVTDMNVHPLIAPQSSIQQALARFYPLQDASGSGLGTGFDESTPGAFPGLAKEVEEESLLQQKLSRISGRLKRLETDMSALLKHFGLDQDKGKQ